jgi:hypothetical protein
MQPYEIIIGPLEVYLAVVGTTFPVVNVTPSASWVQLGKNDMEEAGITVSQPQTIQEWRGVGGTGPRKIARTSEGLEISFTLVDLTLEKYLYAIQGTITQVSPGAGVIGTKALALYQGPTVTTYALVARGASPYGDGWYMQYQVPVVYQKDPPKPVFKKGVPAGLAFVFSAMEDPNASTTAERFGDLIAQYANATS